jgi:hypothetical protein
MQKSWLERNPGWKIPLGCLTLVLLMSLSGAGIATVIVTSFHRSDVYQQAMAIATKNPQVRKRVGEPIRASWLISGSMNVNGSTGNANILIPISGPRGKGVIHAVAAKSGVWRFSWLQVSIEGQSDIDLLSVSPPAERDF